MISFNIWCWMTQCYFCLVTARTSCVFSDHHRAWLKQPQFWSSVKKSAHTAGSGPQEKHKVVKKKWTFSSPPCNYSQPHTSITQSGGSATTSWTQMWKYKKQTNSEVLMHWQMGFRGGGGTVVRWLALSPHSPGFETSLGLFCVFMFSLCLRGFCRYSKYIFLAFEFCFNSKIVLHSESCLIFTVSHLRKIYIYMCFSQSAAQSITLNLSVLFLCKV